MNRRKFLKSSLLWLPFAPAILRAADALTLRDPGFLGVLGAPAASGYTAYASVFDGTNDYMTRGADLTGNADGKKFTISLWIKFNGGDGNIARIFDSGGGYILLHRLGGAGAQIQLTGLNTSDVEILSVQSTSAVSSGSGWHHVFVTGDMGVPGSCHLYLDGIEETNINTFTDGTLNYTHINHAICALITGSGKVNGELCEIYINLAENLNDPTKFASGGKPISLGPGGITPTGTEPIVYQKNPYDSFGTNSGTGGDFTVTGALTEGTPP